MFRILHIFTGVEQICHLLNAKRRVNIPIFTIRNSFGLSIPDIISRRSYTSLRVFAALGQFREMVKSPQIMDMNKQKVLQNLYIHILHPNGSLFKLIDH